MHWSAGGGCPVSRGWTEAGPLGGLWCGPRGDAQTWRQPSPEGARSPCAGGTVAQWVPRQQAEQRMLRAHRDLSFSQGPGGLRLWGSVHHPPSDVSGEEMHCVLSSFPGEMMPTGRKPSGPPWTSATIRTSTARIASTTLTTGTGAATPTTLLTGQPGFPQPAPRVQAFFVLVQPSRQRTKVGLQGSASPPRPSECVVPTGKWFSFGGLTTCASSPYSFLSLVFRREGSRSMMGEREGQVSRAPA